MVSPNGTTSDGQSVSGTTPDGKGYTVTTSELRTHATVLGQVATLLGQALGSAQQVTLADKAYGQLPVSAAFASLVRLVSQPGIAALTQAQTAVSATGDGVRTNAANYDATEHANAASFKQTAK